MAGEPVGPPGGSNLRGGFILSFLEVILRLEMRKYLQILSEMDLLVEIHGIDWRDIFLQDSSGDITIVAPLDIWDYLNIFENPSVASFGSYLRRGAQATFPRILQIRNHMSLEQIIENCWDDLRREYPSHFRSKSLL